MIIARALYALPRHIDRFIDEALRKHTYLSFKNPPSCFVIKNCPLGPMFIFENMPVLLGGYFLKDSYYLNDQSSYWFYCGLNIPVLFCWGGF